MHNFSLLHDDVMDRDVERRHRPTGWVVFGEGQAILAGNAMLIAAIEVLSQPAPHAARACPCLLDGVQELISRPVARISTSKAAATSTVDDVLEMEAGKTAALLACAASIGAVAAGAPGDVVDGLAAFGHDSGMAFQLVDDILGITGDPARTGKSSSSDVRAGKRSAPIVAALTAGRRRGASGWASCSPTARRSPRRTSRWRRKLIVEAGGLDWAAERGRRPAGRRAGPPRPARRCRAGATEPLAALARYVVDRDR